MRSNKVNRHGLQKCTEILTFPSILIIGFHTKLTQYHKLYVTKIFPLFFLNVRIHTQKRWFVWFHYDLILSIKCFVFVSKIAYFFLSLIRFDFIFVSLGWWFLQTCASCHKELLRSLIKYAFPCWWFQMSPQKIGTERKNNNKRK